MLTWNIELKVLKLKYNWKISRNESVEKINFFIKVSDGKFSGLGEVAPNVRYGEDHIGIQNQFNKFQTNVGAEVNSIQELQKSTHGCFNSLRFGIESAYLHYLSAKTGRSLSAILQLPSPVPINTSYTLPIMDPSDIGSFIKTNGIDRFRLLKLKVNSENAFELTKALCKSTNKEICIDANEAFRDPEQVLKFIEKVRNYPVLFLEQPFPEGYIDEYKYLKKKSSLKLFADESIRDDPDLNSIKDQFHGINVKLMKAGGYFKGIEILNQAKSLKLETMIGCMVETSLGISSALHLAPICKYADLDGAFIIEKDPFNFIQERTGAIFLG